MNNTWNKFIYKGWSPIYDRFFNRGSFLEARRQIFKETDFYQGANILFVGVGTGVDLEQIDHAKVNITAIDFSPDMLNQAKKKFADTTIEFLEMDAQNMTFDDERFDYIVASLILSVVPNADHCFQEMKRVARKGGNIIIFDKFVQKGKKIPILKRLIRPIIAVFGTDIGLSFEKLFERNKQGIELLEDKPILFGGMYRKIVLRKQV